MREIGLPSGNAICYSGYRHGQSPVERRYPSREEIAEDLRMIEPHWPLIRLYDCSPHAERVLEVIRRERLGIRVLLGANLAAEQSNEACPWGAHYSAAELEGNVRDNDAEIERLAGLAGTYPDIVFAVAVGNEATVDWSDHIVPVARVRELVRRTRAAVRQPITVCENYVPWQGKLRDLVDEIDFISLHTYPVWESKGIHEAIGYTDENFRSVAQLYPGVPVVISEAGWTTRSNGRGIRPDNASEELQASYCRDLIGWSRERGVLTFVFEAFDEPWKGSPDPSEPEKHWGLFTVDRRPKRVVQELLGAGSV